MSAAGRAAYEAYARVAERQSDGHLPLWPEVPEDIRLCWDAAASGVIAFSAEAAQDF